MMARPILIVLLASVLLGCQAVTTAQPLGTPPPTATPAFTLRPTLEPTPEPTIAPTPRPIPTAAPTPTLPPATEFALNLYEEGDFIPQHTFEWCVGASIQMAHNLVRSERRGSYEDQQAMWELARANSSSSFRGANPKGWAIALEEIGLGPYELVSVPDYGEALRTAAAAIADSGRPVGLVMWRGRHAWVMSGFESIGDPAIHPDFRVTGIRVLDPLYPHGSGTWGPSPEPNALLSPDELATQFVVREPRRWSADLGTGYFLVLPVAEAGDGPSAVTGSHP
jgi:hypothetical protein